MTTAIGWVATALFAASYFFKRQRTLLAIQIVAASVWILYGLGLGAVPVVVANVVVAASAGWSLWRISREERPGNVTTPAEARNEPRRGDSLARARRDRALSSDRFA